MAQFTAKKGVFDKATPGPPPTTEIYLSHERSGGGFFPHPSNVVYPTLETTSLFTLPNSYHRIPMAYFNDTNNTNFYPTLSAPGELDAYPSLNHTSVTEEFNEQAYNTFPYRWGMVGQAGLTANSPTRANYGRCHYNIFVDQCLRHKSQNQCLWLPRTRPRSAVTISRHTLGITGPQLVSGPSTPTSALRTRVVPSSARRRPKGQLCSQPPVVVRRFSFLKA